MQAEKDVFHYAKSFFGFNNKNKNITIVVPHVEQKRALSLHCRYYPLFDYEISPDDAYSTFRVLGLLTTIYGKRRKISIVNDVEYNDERTSNCVFIGGPPTNAYVHDYTRKGPLRFGENNSQRAIHGSNNIYWIEFKELEDEKTTPYFRDSFSIKEDYCLISKNTINNHVQFVIGGLRAFGQRAVYDFLNESNFYRKIEHLFEYPFFRILVRVKVNKNHITKPWEIVEAEKSEDEWKINNNKLNIFLSYASDDWDTRIRFLTKRLKQEYFNVFVANRDIHPADDWEQAIREEIEHRDVVLVCFSRKYLENPRTYVDKEIEIALELNKSIITIRFDDCPIHNHRLTINNWANLSGDWSKKMFDWTIEEDWKREKNLRKLIKVLYKRQLKKNPK